MGKIYKTTVTHLELLSDPGTRAPLPRGKFALIRAERPPVHFYRYLYDVIGRNHVWVNRKKLSDAALAKIIQNPEVEIYVLSKAGVPAGFFELDFRRMPQAELSFLGVMPDFQDQGLGRFLLCEAIEAAWSRGPHRLIVQTCTLDHPRALPLYQRHGFRPYAQVETELEELDGPPF